MFYSAGERLDGDVERFTSMLWNSSCEPVYLYCTWCDELVREDKSLRTKHDRRHYFCKEGCLHKWEDENAWEYEREAQAQKEIDEENARLRLVK